ncbi:hypothetical protein MP638_003589 [Amoeboaphelidium occidentale]|nr:hypothetical protein MP638_003589 [Amoeboaphelidium occidentale]
MASAKRKSKWDAFDDDAEEETQSSKLTRKPKKSKELKSAEKALSIGSVLQAQQFPVENITKTSDYSHVQEVSTEFDYLSQPTKGLFIRSCSDVTEEYDIVCLIQEGTFGAVYKAKHRETGQIMALKKIKDDANEQNGFPLTALREITALQRLQHQNVVTLSEILSETEQDLGTIRFYLAMEYFPYELRQWVREKMPKLDETASKLLFRQVLQGLEFLHSNYYIHRDIKPTNILVTEEGTVKLADFGYVKNYEVPIKDMTPSVTTLWYRAPEILFGKTDYTEKIDIFSAGCVYADILRGGMPLFEGQSEIDQIRQIFTVLGTPSERVLAKYPNGTDFNFTKYSCTLKDRLQVDVSDECLEFLMLLLEPDYDTRLSAKEALMRPYLQLK